MGDSWAGRGIVKSIGRKVEEEEREEGRIREESAW